MIRALWRGEEVTHRGHFVVEEAKLYTRPQQPPKIMAAAITAQTAAWAASWADGLITVSKPMAALKPVVDAFRGEGGAGKPLYLQLQLSFAGSQAQALAAAHREWRTNIFDSPVLADLKTPAQFEAAAEFVAPEDLCESVKVSAEVAQHVEWIQAYGELGFDHIYLHNVHRDQRRFIEVFGEQVLPMLR